MENNIFASILRGRRAQTVPRKCNKEVQPNNTSNKSSWILMYVLKETFERKGVEAKSIKFPAGWPPQLKQITLYNSPEIFKT